MGLEAYLFRIEFISPVPENGIINLLERAGMRHLSEKQKTERFREFYFECRTSNGLTECHCLLPSNESVLSECSLRFSILSPYTVITQTFRILSNLNQLTPIQVVDTEIGNHLYRELRRNGEVDASFSGIEGTSKAAEIRRKSYIPIDVEQFRKNQLGIQKRNIVLNSMTGEIIESGSKTIEQIKKRGVFDRFIGWVSKES